MHTTSSTLLTEGGKQLLEILNYFKEFYMPSLDSII